MARVPRVTTATGLGDQAARGAGVTLGAQLLRAGLQVVALVVLARLLEPRDFGLVAMVTAVIGVAEVLRDFGLSSAAIAARDVTRAERDNLFWVNTGLGLACGVLATAATPLVVALYDEPRLATVVPVLAAVFLVSGANTQYRADLSRRLRFRALAAADIAAQVLAMAVAIGLALAGAGLWAVVGQQVTAATVLLLVNVVSARWLPGRYRRDVPLRRFFRFGGALLGTQSISYLTKNVDNVALGAVWGASVLGVYSRAYQLLMMPLNQVNAPLTRVALPVLSRVRDDGPTYRRYLSRAQLVGCYVTATGFAVGAGLAEPLVALLFGPRWSAVAPVFAVLALGGIFRAVSQLAYWMYLSQDLTGAQLKQFLVTRPLMVLVIVAGTPWGAVGVAAGHSVAYALYWVASLWHVGRVSGVDTGPLLRNATRVLLTVSAPCGVLALAATWLPVPAALQVVVGLLAAAAWLGLLVAVVPAVRADAATVRSFALRAAGRRRAA